MKKIIFILLFFVAFLGFVSFVNAECDSCLIGSVCYSFGDVLDQAYCSINGNFLDQKSLDSSCQNDFECLSGKCSNSRCVDLGVLFDENEAKTIQIQDLIGFGPLEIPTPTTTRGGGGTSTGGRRTIKSFSKVKGGSLTIVSSTTGSVDKVIFKLKNEQRDVRVKVTKLSSLPSNIVVSGGKVYESFEVDINVDNVIFSESRIQFRVDKKWLRDNDYSKNDIKLKKIVNNNLDDLESKYLTDDGVNYIYEAKTSGFSIFSIIAQKSGEIIKNLCGNGRIDSGENCRSCALDVRCQQDEFCDESGICQRRTASEEQQRIQQPIHPVIPPELEKEEVSKFKIAIYIISIFGLLILVFLLYFIFLRKEKYPPRKPLEEKKTKKEDYERFKRLAENYRAQGFSKEQIKESALSSDWPEEVIDKILKRIN